MGGIPPAEPREFRSDIFKQTPPFKSEPETQQTTPQSLGRHWIYQVWSRILDAEVWFAHCQQEVAQLIKKGIQRGDIYTESELAELIQLPYPSSQELRGIQQAKTFFNATIVEIKGSK